MPTEGSPPEFLTTPEAQPDSGTNAVLQQHYPPARAGQAPDQFRARLQAAVEPFHLPLSRLPGHLLVPQYDAVVIGDRESDLNDMQTVRELVLEGVRLDDGTAPRLLVNETLAGESSSFLSWLDAANRRSTFVFIYVTNSFLANTERMRYIEQLYNESVSGPPERRSRIVPVFAPGVDLDELELSIPETALFRNLAGLPLERDAATGRLRMRQRELGRLRGLLRERLDQRRRREDEQVERLRDWAAVATRREGSLLLQRMLDFFSDRAGRSVEEVKPHLAYFNDLLRQMTGESAAGFGASPGGGMTLQEVGSQQGPLDSGNASMPPSRQASNLEAPLQLAGAGPAAGPAAAPAPQPAQPPPPQPQASGGAVASVSSDIVRAVENLHVGSTGQLSVQGGTVHVHVTYVQQFVAGATQAHQNVASPAPDGTPSGGGDSSGTRQGPN